MTKTMENVKTINSAVRTGLLLAIFGFLGYAGWYTYANYIGPSQKAKQALEDLETLKAEFEAQSKELTQTKIEKDRLATSNKLLKVDRRLANVTVNKKDVNEEGEPFFDVSFQEVDSYGNPISGDREFRLMGETLYIDCWLCKFEDSYVEQADELRNASLCIFKKIYGDGDGLDGGHSLDKEDEEGNVVAPGIYHRGPRMTEFEEKIWADFWKIANDPALQKEMGIKASHGQANYMVVEEGKIYQVEVRASGGVSMKALR